MNRFTFFLASIAVFVVVPLLGAPELLLRPEVLYVIVSIAILNFSQPALGKEEAASHKSSDKNTVVLVILCTGLSVAVPIIDFAYFSSAPVNVVRIAAGALVNLLGLALRAWAILILGRYFTATVQIQNEHQLVRSGPYKLLRHPSYTGAFVAIVGISVVLASWIGVLSSVVLMSVAYYFRVKAEETEMRSFFGSEYEKYSKGTYKLIPLIW